MSPQMTQDDPIRRCPKCRGGVTNPAADDGRALEWHITNCLHGEEIHSALHTLLGVSACCDAEEHCNAQ